MKQSLYTTLILLLLCACQKEVSYIDEMAMKQGNVVVTTALNAFHHFDVNTRLLEDDIYKKDPEETLVTSRTLLLYGHNQELLYGPVYNDNTHTTFLIDREELNERFAQEVLDSCFVCVVANVDNGFLNETNAATLQKLHDITYVLPDAEQEFPSARPDQKDGFKGFPMIGYSEKMDLYYDYTSGTAPNPLSINVYLSHLFAKIVVELQVNPLQDEMGVAQFYLDSWQAFNLPRMAKLGAPAVDGETQPFVAIQDSLFNTEISTVVGGSNPVSGNNTLYFTFYMLEHKLNPGNLPGEEAETGATTPWDYPEGIADSERQRYKPLWPTFRQHPAYIELKGTYIDHQQNDHIVTYSIYLGEDNYQNFYINRNSRLYNNIIIKGITNSNDREQINSDGSVTQNVSIDHRVNVEREDYNIFVEREMLLDSHFEVRPVDVEIKNPAEGTYVELYFVDPTPNADGTYNRIKSNDANYQWARMEQINYAVEGNMVYAPNGKRKYFTSTLLSELNDKKNNYGLSATISDNTNNRIWIYVDENPNISTDGIRKIMLMADYYENHTLQSQTRYHFHQHDLFPVYYSDTENDMEYRYLIEYYEEYLYNFDPKDNYGNTTDGMTWGPNEQISYEISAIEANKGDSNSLLVRFLKLIGLDLTGLLARMRAAIVNKAAIYYDFEDIHSGKVHTKKLLDVMDQESGITLADFPRSAAEYCYNKNHRTTSGTVTDDEFNWYLPAISEIQHITAGAYSHFNVFQDKWYWSSQPSYYKGEYKLQFRFWGNQDLGKGDYYFEDTERARATKTKYIGNEQYSYEGSEVEAISYAFTGTYISNDNIDIQPQSGYEEDVIVDPGTAREAGNQFREKVNRVRAVRRKDSRTATGSPTTGWPALTD